MHFTSTTSGQSMDRDMHITLPNDQYCLKANTTMKMIYETRKLCRFFLSTDVVHCLNVIELLRATVWQIILEKEIMTAMHRFGFLMSILLAHPEEKVGSFKPFRESCLLASLISLRFKCSAYSPLHFPQRWGFAKNSHFFGSKIDGELYACLIGGYRQGWCIKTRCISAWALESSRRWRWERQNVRLSKWQ